MGIRAYEPVWEKVEVIMEEGVTGLVLEHRPTTCDIIEVVERYRHQACPKAKFVMLGSNRDNESWMLWSTDLDAVNFDQVRGESLIASVGDNGHSARLVYWVSREEALSILRDALVDFNRE